MIEGYKRIYTHRTVAENLTIWFFAQKHSLTMGEVEELLYLKEQSE